MPIEGATLFKGRDQITEELIAEFQSIISDVHTGEDSVVRILCEVMATVIESSFLSVQILSEDMFVNTSNIQALFRHGEEYGIVRSVGTKSTGNLKFSGTGGTVIPIGTEVAYDPETGADPLFFQTTAAGTLPNPGIPGAVFIADAGAGGALPGGTFEYQVSFLTAAGETEATDGLLPITMVAGHKTQITLLPLGGPGTTGRRIYRQRDATGYHFVADVLDNVTTSYLDNVVENLGGASPLTDSTAEAILVAGQSEDAGLDYNVLSGTITVLTDVPDGITGVTNPAAFSGGTDPELPEEYRVRLIDAIRNPRTGSVGDIKEWAEEVDGVDTATVFSNDNLGVATAGHVTVRIAGPNGTIPGAATITAVSDSLYAKDMANIIIHVGTFTAVPTNVAVTITLQPNYILADVSPSVSAAITAYLNNLQVGETYRVTGVIAAIVGLPGVADVTVTSPSTNQATGATSKRTAGTITVS